MLAEERRLFYVAVTRAQQRLVVTAVASPEDDGEQPSRFLHELGRARAVHRIGRPRRPLSMAGLVAELRRTVADPDQPEPAPTRRRPAAAAARRHRRPRTAGRGVRRPGDLVGAAQPWRSARPVRPDDEPLTMSASALEGLLTCPAQWFLKREAGGEVVSSTSQGFGKVVHALAERIAKGELDVDADLMPLVDEVWGRMEFRTPWSGERERAGGRRRAAPGSSRGTPDRVPAPCSRPSRSCGPR